MVSSNIKLATSILEVFSLTYFHSGFRLYVWSQFCCRAADYTKKYGQWAVVSGSTDGIGLAIAKDLAKRGHSIVVIGRNEAKLAKTKDSLSEVPNVGEVLTVRIDLSDSSPENYERIRLEIDPDHRDIGILVNNAGMFTDKIGRYASFEMDEIRNTVNVNVIATLYLTKMILPGMLARRRGLIINVSSTVGFVPGPYTMVYAATKAFINSFSRSIQMEYSSYPVDIINLTPGSVHTKLLTAIATYQQKPNFFTPSPDEYARTAMNAVSTGINFISGTIIHGITSRSFILMDKLGLIHPIMSTFMYLSGMKIQPD